MICANLVDVVNDVNNDVASVTPYPCLTRKGGSNRVLTMGRKTFTASGMLFAGMMASQKRDILH